MATSSDRLFIELFDPGGLPRALAIVVGTVVVVRLLERLAGRLAERLVSHRLVVKQATTIVSFTAYLLAALVALRGVFRLSTEALFALSGTIAVALGFALKDFAASMMAGLSILTNRPFQVGDRIRFGGYYGEVKEIGLRSVRLVTLDEALVTIPSSRFLTEPVTSVNAGALDCMMSMPFYLAAGAEVPVAKQVVLDAVLASKYLYLGKPVVVLVVNRLSAQGTLVVELTARAHVFDTRHEEAFISDVTERALVALRAQGIALAGEERPAAPSGRGERSGARAAANVLASTAPALLEPGPQEGERPVGERGR